MLLLYHHAMSSASQKVRLYLAEKGLVWESRPLDLRTGEHQTDEYIKLNPRAVVPTLIDDHHVLPESSVIIEYLEERFPSPPLMPREPFERAKVRLWTKQVDESIHDASLAVDAFAIALRQQYLALPDRGRTLIEKIPDIIKRERRRDLVEHGLDCALFRIAVLRMRQLMDDIEAALSHEDWLVAGAFSLADLSFVPYLTRLEDLDLAMMYGDRRRTAAWFDRCKLRPSYRTAVLDWNSGPGIAAMRKAGAEHGPTVHALLNAN